jgi:hypothetical protein
MPSLSALHIYSSFSSDRSLLFGASHSSILQESDGREQSVATLMFEENVGAGMIYDFLPVALFSPT